MANDGPFSRQYAFRPNLCCQPDNGRSRCDREAAGERISCAKTNAVKENNSNIGERGCPACRMHALVTAFLHTRAVANTGRNHARFSGRVRMKDTGVMWTRINNI